MANLIRWLFASFAIAAIAGCTAINDADDFVIDPPAMERDELTPDCRGSGVASQCVEGNVRQLCSGTGAWENAGPACTLGCAEGACYDCTPGTGLCAGSGRNRLRCSEAGRWVNVEPCAVDAPHCVEGECFACSALERTCRDGIPQGCGPDGRWRPEPACPEGQGCVPETGECRACALGELRACRNALGNCAAGVSTCEPDGSWSACNVTPQEDRCDLPGDDGDCDGTPNSPVGGCDIACSADVRCGPAADVGICRTGISRCVDGVLGQCEGAIGPQPRDCTSREDNDCNAVPDYLDETCACDPSDAAPKPCPSSPYDDAGICESQVRTCRLAPGGTTSYWSECSGGVGPQARDCRSHDDNDCDGIPDDESPSCECAPGTSRPCSAGGCDDGVQRCVTSEGGEATYWSECELSTRWLFTAPELLSGLELSGDLWGPAVLPDGSRLLLSASDPEHIYIADHLDGASYGPAALLAGVNGSTTEGTPFVTASGRALYFDSRRRAGNGRDIWRAAATATGWGSAELVPSVNSSAHDQNAWVSPDERLIVFNSDRGGDMDLWAAVWSGSGLGAPLPLDELNSGAADEGPTLTRDGLAVFFASNRSGGSGGLDIWVATRRSVEDPFSSPISLGGVNSDADELDPALGPDGRELFFSSSRGGSYQLYRALRSCDPTAAFSNADEAAQ